MVRTTSIRHRHPAFFVVLLAACMILKDDLMAQQNNTLFFMHAIPQSNFLNPAIQQDCRLFIGLPVISSVHMNVANSGFTLNQMLEEGENGNYSIDADFVSGKLANRNFFSAELHVTILAIGLRHKQYYYTFSINEKDNTSVYYPRDLVSFALEGNTPFEGQHLAFEGTGLYFNHYREFALGVSKRIDAERTVGLKAKLLFGKLNLETEKMNVGLFTQENTFDLLFNVDSRVNASVPYTMELEDGYYDFVSRYDGNINQHIFNRKNPGIALDAGFIYQYSEQITFSGSLLDLGFINYRSNVTNYSLAGDYLYTGPIGDTIISESYFRDLFNSLNDHMDEELTYSSYMHFLDPKLLLGASLKVNSKMNLNALLYNRFNKMKYQNGFMLSVVSRPFKSLETSLSWAYMNRSALNVGFGFAYGRSPLQFYMVSDNLLAPLFPMSTKNANIRFGLNINLGCRKREKIDECGCYWLQKAEDRKERKEKWFR
jgi:hypothetical protein